MVNKQKDWVTCIICKSVVRRKHLIRHSKTIKCMEIFYEILSID